MNTIVQKLAAEPAPSAGRWDALKDHVAASPWADGLLERLTGWQSADAGLAEFQDPATGAQRGDASRDLGDITPYLWLLGAMPAIERLHAQAAARTVDGLLADGGNIHAFDNHDYVLSFYLLYRLSDEGIWRERFLTSCRALRERFFSGAMPAAWIGIDGRPSLKCSATAYGLLELFCLAQTIDPTGDWTGFVAGQLPRIDRALDRQPLPMVPRTAATRFGMTVYNPKPGRPWSRLFKDNSNLIFALLTYLKVTDDHAVVPLLRRIITAIDQTLFDEDAGWAFTEVWQRRGRAVPAEPRLVGNTIAIELCSAVSGNAALTGALDPGKAQAFIDEPLQEAAEEGLVPMAPAAGLQHLDMTVDFVTTTVLWLHGRGEKATAEDVLARGTAALHRHQTARGLATLADRDGPRGDVCIKYNFLVVKLAVCGYLLAHGDALSAAERAFIADVFLIDR